MKPAPVEFVKKFYRHNTFRSSDIAVFESKLFFEGALGKQYRVRYFTLCFLATVIASYGIINNSPATVIGAMIIAPLMTPMMATAAALVMGDTRRDIRSFMLVVSGALLVIVVSCVIGWIHTIMNIITIDHNDQILSRISPRSTDLVIALASGAAGAFALGRDDIADSLPGVAIAISLVPPLCVGGLCMSLGEWSAAWGAILFFITNYLSILLAGGGVFLLLGLHKVTREPLGTAARRHAFATVLVGVALVSIPLLATSSKLAKESFTEFRTIESAYHWLEGSGYRVHKVEVVRKGVNLLIAGEGRVPDVEDLTAALQRRLRRSIVVNLQIVPVVQTSIRIEDPEGV
jgi:uncharacterized hydrophobic protein (TIGR00271 family)